MDVITPELRRLPSYGAHRPLLEALSAAAPVSRAGSARAAGRASSAASSSSCVPTARTRPPSMTRIRSAVTTLDSRWATTRTVVRRGRPRSSGRAGPARWPRRAARSPRPAAGSAAGGAARGRSRCAAARRRTGSCPREPTAESGPSGSRSSTPSSRVTRTTASSSVVGRVRRGEPEVVRERAGQDRRVLLDVADRGPQLGQRPVCGCPGRRRRSSRRPARRTAAAARRSCSCPVPEGPTTAVTPPGGSSKVRPRWTHGRVLVGPVAEPDLVEADRRRTAVAGGRRGLGRPAPRAGRAAPASAPPPRVPACSWVMPLDSAVSGSDSSSR